MNSQTPLDGVTPEDSGPRFPALPREQWSEEVREAMQRWDAPFNFHKTLAHNPATLRNWIGFGEHILFQNALSPRYREIAVLRVARNSRCDYEWGAHCRYAQHLGVLNLEEIERLLGAADNPKWSDAESAIVSGVDDLMSTHMISQPIWQRLSRHYGAAELVDLVFIIGNFNMLAMFMKSFRIELDPGLVPLPVDPTEAARL